MSSETELHGNILITAEGAGWAVVVKRDPEGQVRPRNSFVIARVKVQQPVEILLLTKFRRRYGATRETRD